MIPQNINDEFEKNFAFIQRAVDESDAEKIVVVTHHPTNMMIDNTHLVSNPLGYVFCGENTNFNNSALIEV